MGYSEYQKYEIICLFYLNNKNISRVRREYYQRFPGQRIPSRNTIMNIVRRFGETKCTKRKTRTVVVNEEEELNILLYFQGKLYFKSITEPKKCSLNFLENPERSIPDAANYMNKSLGKIQNTLTKHHLQPYKFSPVQNLTDAHKIPRLHYCHEIIGFLQNDRHFFNKIIFTDEATFTTAGMFNRKNKHYWSTENPRKIQVVKIQGRRALHVWCGMLNNKVMDQ